MAAVTPVAGRNRRPPASPTRAAGHVRVPIPIGMRAGTFEWGGAEYVVWVLPPREPRSSATRLTDAEQAVATLVLEGFSNHEIGVVRRTSARTVANQLQAIYRKLAIASRTELGLAFHKQ